MAQIKNQEPIQLTIKSPLSVAGEPVHLSDEEVSLGRGENLMLLCEKGEMGSALVRAILGLEELSKGAINVDFGEKRICLASKKNLDCFKEEIRMAYVSEDGSDFCSDLTFMENLCLIKDRNDLEFDERVQKISSDFMVREILNDYPLGTNVHRRKIFSIIRAWASLPDIIVYLDPLKHLDDLSRVELLRNFAESKKKATRLNVVYAFSRGEFSDVLGNFRVVEILNGVGA